MDNSTFNEEWLYRYLDGELSEGEVQRLKEALSANPALKNELEDLRAAKKAVGLYGLNQQVGAIHREMMDELKETARETRSTKVRRIIRYTIAAAASVILVVLGIAAYQFYRLSPDRLYTANYTPFELTVFRDTYDADNTNDIGKAYLEKRYQDIVRQEGQSGLSARDIFLTGMANLELNHDEKAISDFQIALATLDTVRQTRLRDATEYYLALAYLRNQDYNQAIDLMTKIHENRDHLYQEKFTNKFIRKVKMLGWR